MDPETQRALDAIDRAVAEIRQLMAHPVVLSARYLAAIDSVADHAGRQLACTRRKVI